MGFFYTAMKKPGKAQSKGTTKKKVIPIHLLNEGRCTTCSLNEADAVLSPKLRAIGAITPDIYILGEYPTEKDDRVGEVFAGKSGDMVFDALPRKYHDRTRLFTTTRCHAQKITTREIESCRLHIIEDIEYSKPKIVIGLGNDVLKWATNITGGISAWRGNILPAKFGTHYCWFMPTFSPSFLQQKLGKYGKSEWELVFEKDIKDAIRFLRNNQRSLEYIEDGYSDGITVIEGRDHDDYLKLKAKLEQLVDQECGLDFETTALRPYPINNNNPTFLSCAIGTFKNTVAFPLFHPDGWSEKYQHKVWDLFIWFLLNVKSIIAHNKAFEAEWIAYKMGAEFIYKFKFNDTYAQSFTIDERKGVHSLGDCTKRWYGFDIKAQSHVDVVKWREYKLKDILLYNGMDTKWTHKLFQDMRQIIETTPNYEKEYLRKLKVIKAAVLTQMRGVYCNVAETKRLQVELQNKLSIVSKKLENDEAVIKYKRVFGAFNPGSPDHVSTLMRKILKREEGNVYDDYGDYLKYSVDEDVLNRMPADEVPCASLILESRVINKLLSTYINPVINKTILYDDGLIHTSYNIMFTSTGRSSSSNPNMQNYPKHKYKHIRKIIEALAGRIFYSIDFGQIEARVIAMASRDKKFVNALWHNLDVHTEEAGEFFALFPKWADLVDIKYKLNGDEAKIKKQMRQEAKNLWVFPQFFGASIKSCANNLNLPIEICQENAEKFWKKYAGVKKWQEELIEFYRTHLYVETLTGRRRRGVMTKNEIINTGIQGTASDIVTNAWAELAEEATFNDIEEYLANLNIHDDLTFELFEEHSDLILPIAKVMTKPCFDFINVPLIVEVSKGRTWDESEKVQDYSSVELWNHTRAGYDILAK